MTPIASLINAAERHAPSAGAMRSSADVCLADAHAAVEREDFRSARMWALRSLSYSVGVFHADYTAGVAS